MERKFLLLIVFTSLGLSFHLETLIDKFSTISYNYDIVADSISNSQEIILSKQDEKLTLMLKALGNPVRFHIVKTLAEKKMCITGEIVEFTNLAQSTVSQHLKVLRDAGLIYGEIEGPATNYCLNEQGVRWLKEQIGNWLPECCEEPKKVKPDLPSRNCC